MSRPWIFIGMCGALALLLGCQKSSRPKPQSRAGGSGFDRTLFVCTDDRGGYSAGVYLHGTTGSDALELVPYAAPFMRTPETGDAAAGLCGFLFKQLGDDVARLGGLSLYDAPRPAKDGAIDWQAYCGENVDLILIHLEK